MHSRGSSCVLLRQGSGLLAARFAAEACAGGPRHSLARGSRMVRQVAKAVAVAMVPVEEKADKKVDKKAAVVAMVPVGKKADKKKADKSAKEQADKNQRKKADKKSDKKALRRKKKQQEYERRRSQVSRTRARSAEGRQLQEQVSLENTALRAMLRHTVTQLQRMKARLADDQLVSLWRTLSDFRASSGYVPSA